MASVWLKALYPPPESNLPRVVVTLRPVPTDFRMVGSPQRHSLPCPGRVPCQSAGVGDPQRHSAPPTCLPAARRSPGSTQPSLHPPSWLSWLRRWRTRAPRRPAWRTRRRSQASPHLQPHCPMFTDLFKAFYVWFTEEAAHCFYYWYVFLVSYMWHVCLFVTFACFFNAS